MTWVVTERCNDCRYTDCVSVCPVDCFYEITEPYHMVVIDPDTCVDCAVCETVCPAHAIYRNVELPEPYKKWLDLNRELYPRGQNITETKGPLPEAFSLEEIQQRERERGIVVHEPKVDR
jgi:ferredoxin